MADLAWSGSASQGEALRCCQLCVGHLGAKRLSRRTKTDEEALIWDTSGCSRPCLPLRPLPISRSCSKMSKLEFSVPHWRVTAISLGHRILGTAKHNKKDLRRAEVQTEEWRGKKKKENNMQGSDVPFLSLMLQLDS